MKLIKIGSSPSCNIVLHSDFVSSHHAEMILLDSGEIILEDKNSTNGTFVGNKKIDANREITVKRGDYIRFADVELQWNQVPMHENNSKYKAVINIGTNFRNDIVISGNYPSRFHAVLKVTKDNNAYITDLGSKNGTKVNGVKLQAGKELLIKRGDNVICGDVDVSEQLMPFIPDPWIRIKKFGIPSIVAALFVGIVAILLNPVMREKIKAWFGGDGEVTDYRPAVVWVRACYHYVVTFEDNPIPDQWDGDIEIQLTSAGQDLGAYIATAFFIDREGRLATNRHVAVPWSEEYRNTAETTFIKDYIQSFKDNLQTIRAEEDLIQLSNVRITDLNSQKSIGNWLIKSSNSVRTLNSKINQIKQSKYTISGKLDYITVGYPGRNYTHLDEFARCYVLTESGTPDKDIALLQMNDKKTPDDIKYVFDVKKFSSTKLEPLKETLYTIGYPAGNYRAIDKTNHSLEPDIREVKCSKVPEKYDFEFQGESLGGASGSPIFRKNGELVGILWGGSRLGATFGVACQAKYLKDMYIEEVGHE